MRLAPWPKLYKNWTCRDPTAAALAGAVLTDSRTAGRTVGVVDGLTVGLMAGLAVGLTVGDDGRANRVGFTVGPTVREIGLTRS